MLAFAFAVLLVALALGVAGLEWYLRHNAAHFLGNPSAAFRMFEMDGERGFWLAPGWEGTLNVAGRELRVHVNSKGMRGAEIAPPGNEKRVLLLGDSMVFGHGVADDETMAVALEKLLAASIGPAWVGNGGVAGYGTAHLAKGLRHHAWFRPDAVVAFTYLGNDFVDDCQVYSAVVDGYLLSAQAARLAHESLRFRLMIRYRTAFLVERLLEQHLPALAFDRSQIALTPQELEAFEHFPPQNQQFVGLFMDRIADDALVEKVLRRCRESFRALHAQAGGTPILHVVLPTWWHLHEAEWRDHLEKQGYRAEDHRFGRMQQRLLALAADLGFEMIDLTPALQGASDPAALFIEGDGHFSPRGHEFVARALAPTLVRWLAR